MSEDNFQSLQNMHESLLQKQQKVDEANQKDFAVEVKVYIEQAKRSGSNISSTRERDQIRANLRYWANYIYGIEGIFPDTELAPSTVTSNRTSLGKVSILTLGIVILIGVGTLLFREDVVPTIGDTPTVVPPTVSIQITPTSEAIIPVETPTSLFVGSDVVLTDPENGENVPPRVLFKGAYTNLKTESTIHVLLIRGDKFYPIDDFFKIPEESTTGEWEIEAALYQNPDELKQPENLIVVPAACFDQSCRETLGNAVQTGLATDALPSPLSFTLYRDSSRVVYRNAYHAITEVRLVYSYYDGESYDLYTSKPDGSDIRQITFTPGVSELSPRLSPDGTKIVYVHNTRSIHIMDSNGQNDRELINGGKNVLEHPQWSPDSSYISYTVGDTSISSIETYWSIHIRHLSTGDDSVISGETGVNIRKRYHSWVPNSNLIIFNAGIEKTGSSGFVQISIDSPENFSIFFDTAQEEIQPDINLLGNGYLLTYTVVNPNDFSHDIYAVIASSRQSLFDGLPIRLTKSLSKNKLVNSDLVEWCSSIRETICVDVN